MKMALQNASFLYTVFYCFESGSLRWVRYIVFYI
jgi:hypothetical protein